MGCGACGAGGSSVDIVIVAELPGAVVPVAGVEDPTTDTVEEGADEPADGT